MFSFAFLIENMFDLTYLKKYNKKNGWYVNWALLAEENEIYALVVEGSVDIQGLVAIAPDNNKLLTDDIRYLGVGGHLFAIDEVNAKKIMEVYDYDWTDEEI